MGLLLGVLRGAPPPLCASVPPVAAPSGFLRLSFGRSFALLRVLALPLWGLRLRALGSLGSLPLSLLVSPSARPVGAVLTATDKSRPTGRKKKKRQNFYENILLFVKIVVPLRPKLQGTETPE